MRKNYRFRPTFAICAVAAALAGPGCTTSPGSAQSASPKPVASASTIQIDPVEASPIPLSSEPPPASMIRRGGPPSGLDHLTAPIWNYRIKNRYPHDPTAFTQGLLVGPEGDFYEGTGLNGHSELRRVDIVTGKVKASKKLDQKFFGEGIALLDNQLVELTWQNKIALRYAFKDFKPSGSWNYSGEGWGLTTRAKQFLMSNGSSTLSWRDPKDFHETASLKVTDGGKPVAMLNELEWIDGEIWANVWQSDYIAVIEPKDGKVKAWLDLRGLLSPDQEQRADVLNGIAWDPKGKRLFITGKLWPTVFEVEIVR
jgi:glutamine cyclotransferase